MYRGAHSDQPLASIQYSMTSGGWTLYINACGQHFRIKGTILGFGGGCVPFCLVARRENWRTSRANLLLACLHSLQHVCALLRGRVKMTCRPWKGPLQPSWINNTVAAL
jgi:hypothetical protein